jgi:hypothetical protein
VLGIPRARTEGSKLLIQAAAQAGANAMEAREFREEERKVRPRIFHWLKLGRHLIPGYQGPKWTDAKVQLLGSLQDADLAAIVDKTA